MSINPAAIMAAHENHAEVGYEDRLACVPHDPLRGEFRCLPYRLAEALLTYRSNKEARAQHLYETGLRAGALGGERPNGADAAETEVEQSGRP